MIMVIDFSFALEARKKNQANIDFLFVFENFLSFGITMHKRGKCRMDYRMKLDFFLDDKYG